VTLLSNAGDFPTQHPVERRHQRGLYECHRAYARSVAGSGWVRVSVVTALALCVAACASTKLEASTDQSPRSQQSASFTTRPVPPGYTSVASSAQVIQYAPWGDDTEGTAEPYTVLAPRKRPWNIDRVVVVSVTGYKGYEGNLHQAAPGGRPEMKSKSFKLDGRDAIYTPAQTNKFATIRWDDLVAVRGPDIAVRVRALHGSRARLVSILRTVKPSTDHATAPRVPDPPSGLVVLGRVDAAPSAVPVLDASIDDPQRRSSWLSRGNPVAHVSRWTSPDATLTVTTLPAFVASLPAMRGGVALSNARTAPTAHTIDIGASRGIAIEEPFERGYTKRTVYWQAPWGNLVTVAAAGRGIPAMSTLADLAASVRPTSRSSA
jgi:hypothetical protein